MIDFLLAYDEYLDGKRDYKELPRPQRGEAWRCQHCDRWFPVVWTTNDNGSSSAPVLCKPCREIHESARANGGRAALPAARIVKR